MNHTYHFTRASENSKTGPIPVTTSSVSTCPHTSVYHGNLVVAEDETTRYAHITKVIGYLSVRGEAHLPLLVEVCGRLYVNARSRFPALTKVGGRLCVRAESHFPLLKSVGSRLEVYAGARLPALMSVSGGLFIHAEIRLPALTNVDGGLWVRAGIQFDHSRITFSAGHVLAIHEYALHASSGGLYRSFCRGPWNAETALAHWDAGHPAQARAQAFRAAILAHEKTITQGESE